MPIPRRNATKCGKSAARVASYNENRSAVAAMARLDGSNAMY
jgi:hypothetical protein